jgi:hypothetical protein
MTPGRFGFVLLLALVLLGHWTGLSWLRDQVQPTQPLAPMAEPVLTRFIAPVHMTPPQPPQARMAPRTSRNAVVAVATDTPTPSTDTPREATPEGLLQPDAPVPSAPALDEGGAPAQTTGVTAPEQAASSPAPDDWPADTRLSYRMTGYVRGDLHGSGRVQWQREQDRYQVRVDLRAALVFRVSMISQGEVTDAGLVPRAYEEQLPGRRQGVAFEAETIRFHDGTRLLKPHALQDTASQFVELSRRFSTGRETLKVGEQVRVWLARPMGMALWTYDVVGEDTLQTPEFGPVQAFHLRPGPIANPRGVITAEMWFAPSLQYLPVRVRISLGADNFVDLMVERIEQGEAPAPQTPGSAALP